MPTPHALLQGNAAATGEWFPTDGLIACPQAALLDATAAVVVFEVTNVRQGSPVQLGEITLSSGTPSDTFAVDPNAKWPWVRARIVSATGGQVLASAVLGH